MQDLNIFSLWKGFVEKSMIKSFLIFNFSWFFILFELIKRQSWHHIEMSQLICTADQLTVFCMMISLGFNELLFGRHILLAISITLVHSFDTVVEPRSHNDESSWNRNTYFYAVGNICTVYVQNLKQLFYTIIFVGLWNRCVAWLKIEHL